MKRTLKFVGLTLAAIYAMACLALYVAMRQTPDRFGAIMARVPMQTMMVLPFKPLWMSARGGVLSEGDTAPDFSLLTLERNRTVKLSDEYREKPVVLVFGSYT